MALEGTFKRPTSVPIDDVGKEYGNTAGYKPLREAVAHLYNEHHRQGKVSKYTYENVCIVPGGRAGLVRVAAVLGNQYMGFFIPDYTAYNELLSLFRSFTPIPIPLSKEDGWHINEDLIREEAARGTGILLTSNPRNPTGEVVKNPELKNIQDMCRGNGTLIMDEFYGGYNYTTGGDGSVISAAENIDDVNSDDVLILDGLTKRFRLPYAHSTQLCSKEFLADRYIGVGALHGWSGRRLSSKRSVAAALTSTAARTFLFSKQLFPCSSRLWSR